MTAERERLLWADHVRIEKVHQGTTYARTFEGVARKLERLHVDKDEDQIPRAGKEAYRRLFTERTCPDCGGVRLNAAARAVELAGTCTSGPLVNCELTVWTACLRTSSRGTITNRSVTSSRLWSPGCAGRRWRRGVGSTR